ncbi:ATP-binding cassette domain-containing protein [Nesterenkonia xinjiangensis]|uniref:D-methionine transport system ATP-binding protein n=1 Tax=Nesterenkonia xinjiangensis TaxID=225327 RepID=A0A7Z0KCI4_9MICC|nr:ATP-binding cassette domain-containing protein [Nesterenkonia xinjiangensis]NYJ78652.1 D-methionine transport system ATP-binding protein [Nesterenkonia xinjiangensis]
MIELQHVTKTYRRRGAGRGGPELHALRGIDLTIQDEEMFGVVGESGSGKSSLLRMINHLEAPTAGRVLVDGVDLAALSPRARRARRRRIGMVFQQFNLLANKTVFDNAALPLRLQRRRERDRVMQMLDFVNMADHAHKHPSLLSGGEKQRVAIARALVTEPGILLCDEPTSALDDHHTEEVMEILGQIRRELRTTIVLVSHELDVIKASCDRAAVLERGRLTAVADVVAPPPREAFATYAERAQRYLA